MRFIRFRDWPLRYQLIAVQGAITVALIAGLWALFVHQEKVMLKEVREYTRELSKAIELSVQKFNDPKLTDADLVKAYEETLRKRGVKEITILEPDRTVLATTSKKRRQQPVMVEEKIGEMSEGRTSENIIVPLISEGETIGYIHLELALDDFADEQARRAKQRMQWVLFLLVLAGGAMFFLASRMLGPVQALTEAAEHVAAGDLGVALPAHGARDEIGRLVDAFGRMVDSLRAGRAAETRARESEKNAMLGVMGAEIAHEIRNPLNFINLSVDHLQARYPVAEPAARDEIARIGAQIKTEIQRLTRMTEDYMMLARPQPLLREPVLVAQLAGETAFMLGEPLAAGEVRMELHIPEGFTLSADPDQLRTVLINLVSNALHASPAGGVIRVGAERENGEAVITVRDDGPGISPQDLPRIFETYFTTRAGGTGLGLAISKRIVEAHGGSLSAESVPGRGTVFTLRLPEGGAGGAG